MPRIDRKTFERWQRGEIKLANLFGVDAKQIAALFLTGYNMFSEGRLDEAKGIFEGITALDDKNVYAFSILGAIYQKQENYNVALARYNQALLLFPEDINSLTNRGEVYLKLGKFDEAAADLKKAIELDPTRQHPSANRARLLVALVTDALKTAKEKGVEAVLQSAKQAAKK
jgi:Flp pilus assembly protein TadD, contains TPR repeats